MKDKKLFRKLLVGFLRFFAWWGGMFAILGGTRGICPFCGQPGCMGGPASVGFLAGLVVIFMSLPKNYSDVNIRPEILKDRHKILTSMDIMAFRTKNIKL